MAFASLALADVTVTVTRTLTYSSVGYEYTATSESTYTTADPTSSSAPSSTSAPESTNATTTHSIQVGPSGQLVYSPSNISANVGDTVAFFFNPKNHTVTQSSFAQPCEKLEASTGKVGLTSGFIPTTVSLTTANYSFVVNDTSALWFYCGQIGHCSRGMVFAVNADEDKTFAAFQANAERSNTSSTSSTPSAGSGGSTGSTGSATGASVTGTGASASSTSSSSSQNDNGAISTSVNFGLTAVLAVIGGAILVL